MLIWVEGGRKKNNPSKKKNTQRQKERQEKSMLWQSAAVEEEEEAEKKKKKKKNESASRITPSSLSLLPPSSLVETSRESSPRSTSWLWLMQVVPHTHWNHGSGRVLAPFSARACSSVTETQKKIAKTGKLKRDGTTEAVWWSVPTWQKTKWKSNTVRRTFHTLNALCVVL